MPTKTVVKPFQFKQFFIGQEGCAMKVGTDGVLLGAWANLEGTHDILDIGTGTGVIAVMLAQRTETARIEAVEIDENSCRQATENMQQSPWAARLQCHLASIQDFAKTSDRRYDLIVSNPPFFSGGTFSNSQDKASVRHTVKLPHGDLLYAVKTLLTPHGRFCLILPHLEGLRFRELANTYGLYCTRQTEVAPRPGKPIERLLLQFERTVKPLDKSSLHLMEPEEADTWSLAYRQLTGAFYLKM